MSRWIVPNTGSVVLILGNDKDSLTDKLHLLQVFDTARKVGPLPGDLDKFRVLLASQIELEAALAKAAA